MSAEKADNKYRLINLHDYRERFLYERVISLSDCIFDFNGAFG